MAYTVLEQATVVTNQMVGRGRTYVMKIRDMANEDRPRERLAKSGAGSLSVQELLAVVLGTGTTREDVMTMATRIVKEYGERTIFSQTNPARLAEDLSIPITKAAQIVACGELGRRFYPQRTSGLAVLRTGKDVHNYVRDMERLPKEHLRGIYLNTHYRVIHDEVISIGTINANLIHPREVFKPAIEYGAAGIILVHNHPSGITKASEADIEITEQLVQVGKIIGIGIVDHVIVGGNKWASVDVVYN